jgi:hypothetical protein
MSNANQYMVQLEIYQSFSNLLFSPTGSPEEQKQKARKLFEIYGDPSGAFTYMDFEEQAIKGIRSREVDGIKLYPNADGHQLRGHLFVEDPLSGLNMKTETLSESSRIVT